MCQYKIVKSADLATISDDKKQLGEMDNMECDCILVPDYWTPSLPIVSLSWNKTNFNEEIDAFIRVTKNQ